MNRLRYTSLWMMLIITSLLFSGCLIKHVSYSGQTSSGPHLSQSKVESIEPGMTTKEWIIDAFGQPTMEKDFGDGNEVLEYKRSYVRKEMVKVFFLFKTENTRKTRETLVIELTDGIVQEYWVE